MKKRATQLLTILNAVILAVLSIFACTCYFIDQTWGTVDISQMLFFMRVNSDGVLNFPFICKIIFCCLAFPVMLTTIILYLAKRFSLSRKCFINSFLFIACLAAIYCLATTYLSFNLTDWRDMAPIFILLFIFNLKRNFSAANIFLCLILANLYMFCFFITTYQLNILTAGNNQNSNFYAENFKDISRLDLKNDTKRNIILIFVESFNEDFKSITENESQIRVADADAVKFSDFIEGYVQRWTQAAIFSAFTGTHIHYISDYWHFKQKKRVKMSLGGFNPLSMFVNELSETFDFDTPKIYSLGKAAQKNGYQNLFIKGADVTFSGTKNFLLNNGFLPENIYGEQELEKVLNFPPDDHNCIHGYSDKDVYETFKNKISSFNPDKPFFAAMLTLELHVGSRNYAQILKNNILNLNDFIVWFKEQSFYQNTTLIVVGDHNKMGNGIKPGAKIYNAFFNLPPELKNNLNLNRTFNQIDMFPTILEIMGFNLPERKAGLGTSLFSHEKTLAEKYSYEKQKEILSKKDSFYYRLWQK